MNYLTLFSTIDTWDRIIFLWFNHLPHPYWLNSIAIGIHLLTLTGLIFLLFSFWILKTNKISGGKIAVLALIAWFIAFSINYFIFKPLFNRNRPGVSLENVYIIGTIPDNNSFPSGQVTTTVAYAVPLFMYKLKRKYKLTAFWICIITAFDRVYMGHHYPLDVMGGAIAGLGIGYIVSQGYHYLYAHKLRK